jgi:hypothetical protein
MNGDEGYCSPHSWHTAVSAATERGNTVTDQQHQESSEDFGGTVGKGKAAGWNLGELGGRTALSWTWLSGVLYNCAYSSQ